MYWTDWSKNGPAIYRSSVVNPAPETLISGNLYWPNALAIDFRGKQAANIRATSSSSVLTCTTRTA